MTKLTAVIGIVCYAETL